MKKLILPVLFLAFILSSNAQNLNEFRWLIGTWERTQTRPGTTAVEVWSQLSDGSLTGLGLTMKGGLTQCLSND